MPKISGLHLEPRQPDSKVPAPSHHFIKQACRSPLSMLHGENPQKGLYRRVWTSKRGLLHGNDAYQCFQYYYPGSTSHIKRLNTVGVVRKSEREISQDGFLKGITPRGKGKKPLPPPCGDREPRRTLMPTRGTSLPPPGWALHQAECGGTLCGVCGLGEGSSWGLVGGAQRQGYFTTMDPYLLLPISLCPGG